MQDERFFHSTRGKIVMALRRRHSASAVDLAGEFGLSTNAVRQQLLTLERDGYVAERSVRRGPTKPTLEYSLTESAESLFPSSTTGCSTPCCARSRRRSAGKRWRPSWRGWEGVPPTASVRAWMPTTRRARSSSSPRSSPGARRILPPGR